MPPGWTLQRQGAGVGSAGPEGPTFRGCCAVSEAVCWVSGSGGTVIRTADGGATWDDVSPPGLGELEFRDVHAFSADSAFILSVGNGGSSRIMRTRDGGQRWDTVFVNDEEEAFYNFLGFFDDGQMGIAFSDTVEGRFRIITTSDAGESWSVVPQQSLPAALEGEGAFAASGKNMALRSGGLAWIGMGAAARARVLRSDDFGNTWQVAETPLDSGPSAGIFSLAALDDATAVAVGGDYQTEDEAVRNVAVTDDGGVTWQLAPEPGGFRSVAAFVETERGPLLLALGPSGADLSTDCGKSWRGLPTPVRGLHTYSQAPGAVCGWAAGAGGAVARLEPTVALRAAAGAARL